MLFETYGQKVLSFFTLATLNHSISLGNNTDADMKHCCCDLISITEKMPKLNIVCDTQIDWQIENFLMSL